MARYTAHYLEPAAVAVTQFAPIYPDAAPGPARNAALLAAAFAFVAPFVPPVAEATYPDAVPHTPAHIAQQQYIAQNLRPLVPSLLAWHPQHPDATRRTTLHPAQHKAAYMPDALVAPPTVPDLSWQGVTPDVARAAEYSVALRTFYTRGPSQEELPAPDLSWSPEYPSLLLPAARVVEFPFSAFVAPDAPELAWLPQYPDFLRSLRPVTEHQFAAFIRRLPPPVAWFPEFDDFTRALLRRPHLEAFATAQALEAFPIPELAWAPEYPDFARRLQRLHASLHRFSQRNFVPIAALEAPTGVAAWVAVFPDFARVDTIHASAQPFSVISAVTPRITTPPGDTFIIGPEQCIFEVPPEICVFEVPPEECTFAVPADAPLLVLDVMSAFIGHPIKDPDDISTWTLDWEAFLAKYPGGVTIDSSTWILPTGITEVSSSDTTTTTIIQTSGGTLGRTYDLISRATLSNGDRKDRTLRVTIRQK